MVQLVLRINIKQLTYDNHLSLHMKTNLLWQWEIQSQSLWVHSCCLKTLKVLFTDTLPQPETSSQCFCISLARTKTILHIIWQVQVRSHILVHFLPKSSMFITWTRRYFCNRQILDSFGETVKQGSTSQFDIFVQLSRISYPVSYTLSVARVRVANPVKNLTKNQNFTILQ